MGLKDGDGGDVHVGANEAVTATNFGMIITAVSSTPGLVLVVLSFPSILETQSLLHSLKLN